MNIKLLVFLNNSKIITRLYCSIMTHWLCESERGNINILNFDIYICVHVYMKSYIYSKTMSSKCI